MTFPDVYVHPVDQPPDVKVRPLAAYRPVEDWGVPSGYSAAVLLDAGPPHPRPQVWWVVQESPARTAVWLLAGPGQRTR